MNSVNRSPETVLKLINGKLAHNKKERMMAKNRHHVVNSYILFHKIITGNVGLLVGVCHRLSTLLVAEPQKQIRNKIKIVIIRPSSRSWRSPITLLVKRDGSGSFCVDYRNVKKKNNQIGYSLPNVGDVG